MNNTAERGGDLRRTREYEKSTGNRESRRLAVCERGLGTWDLGLGLGSLSVVST